jgi:hypothetical protein
MTKGAHSNGHNGQNWRIVEKKVTTPSTSITVADLTINSNEDQNSNIPESNFICL